MTAVVLGFRRLAFVPGLSLLASGSGRWLCVTMSASMTLGTLAARVKAAGQRRALIMLAGVVILRAGTLPFLGPVLARAELDAINSQTDGRGVCLQSTPFNCGPASAVTALRSLGLEADERAIALACKTDGVSGTADDVLAKGLSQIYRGQGLLVAHRFVPTVEELREWPASIAVIRFNYFTDHYVAVLGFEGDRVIVGDPLTGRESWSLPEFAAKWHHVAIMLRLETK
jgi:Peptidase C39 family